jgi:hypothetical protein
MKAIFLLLASTLILIFAGIVSAQVIEPVISKNVHVLRNVTPAQCPTSWRGDASASDVENETGQGSSNYEIASGVSSCDSCAFDRASGDCVCATCYDNYN